MDCWHCGSELIWGGDHDYEDWAGEAEGEGIVSNFSCPTCPAVVYVYLPIDGEQESTETVEGFVCDTCGKEKQGEAFIRTLPPARMTMTCAECYDRGILPC